LGDQTAEHNPEIVFNHQEGGGMTNIKTRYKNLMDAQSENGPSYGGGIIKTSRHLFSSEGGEIPE